MKKIYLIIFYLKYLYKSIYFLFVSTIKIVRIKLTLLLIIKFIYNWIQSILMINFKNKNIKTQFKSDIKKFKFSNDWFTNNIQIWCHIFKKENFTKINKILEIGSFEGMSAIFFLNYFKGANIDCVETFKGSDEHSEIDFLKVKNNFDYNIKSYEKRLNLYKMTSDNFFKEKKDVNNNYDLIYIDGSHFANQVIKDASNSFDKLNINGIMIYDDFLRQYYEKKDENVIGGVCEFLKIYDNKIKIIFGGYQLFIKKIKN